MENKYTKPEFLNALRGVRWKTALRTYGNAHSTLIGLIVDWWIKQCPEKNFALDGGPSFGHVPQGRGRGNCDALLGQNDSAVGILEVEGAIEEKLNWCAEKIRGFFGANEYTSLQFAILLVYPIAPSGRGKIRQVQPIDLENRILPLVKPISKQYPDKEIIVIKIDKNFKRINQGIRARNDYYQCTPTAIWGALLVGGKVKGPTRLDK